MLTEQFKPGQNSGAGTGTGSTSMASSREASMTKGRLTPGRELRIRERMGRWVG